MSSLSSVTSHGLFLLNPLAGTPMALLTGPSPRCGAGVRRRRARTDWSSGTLVSPACPGRVPGSCPLSPCTATASLHVSPGRVGEFPLVQPVYFPGDESLRPGTLKQWQLTLYGSSWSPAEMRERQR